MPFFSSGSKDSLKKFYDKDPKVLGSGNFAKVYKATVKNDHEVKKPDGTFEKLPKGMLVAIKDIDKAKVEDMNDITREIEVMEQIEPHRAALDVIEERIAGIESTLADAAERRDAALAVVDAELAVDEAHRVELAEAVDPGLLATYEELRARLGGVGAAVLDGRRCMGCHIELPSADAQVIRGAPESDVVTCTECGRILIR